MNLIVSSSPHIHGKDSVPKIMLHVILALLPAAAASIYFFGIRALWVMLVSIITAEVSEYLFLLLRKKDTTAALDGSAFVTGLLLALTLPPSINLSMVGIGSAVAIIVAKQMFGGFGANVFNPALVGRAFLQAAFPIPMTTWVPNRLLHVDATTVATPLGGFKFSHLLTAHKNLLLGNVSGSLGETSALLLLLGGLYLLVRRYIDWRIPVGILTSVFVFDGILWLFNSQKYPDPVFMLLAGGLMLGAWFMATDPVTSPVSPAGIWIYSVGIGFFVVLIRLFGGMPEGVMYSILIMNSFVPLLDKYLRQRMLGERK